ncbi:MAG: tRNA (adenosine(37)-N6)-dimethylallyltransferase MiaA [Chitinophagales bacterium]
MKKLIVITGPTAAGKTSLSIQVAKHFKTHIISADARQLYREMNIGTSKPSVEQLSEVPHHFINHISVHDHYSAGKFEEEALCLLGNLFTFHDTIVMAGGSGLFINAVIDGFDAIPPAAKDIKENVIALYKIDGIEALQNLLQKHDPEYYKTVDLKNPHRLIRALVVCLSSGRPFSSFRKATPAPRDFISFIAALEIERNELNQRIHLRVDEMMRNGLLEEAGKLFPHRDLTPLQTVGYIELFSYLEGIISLDDAVSLIKQHTRNYAKRQMTWFRKMKNIHWFQPDKLHRIIQCAESYSG